MSDHRPQVADVFRQHEQEFLQCWGHTLSGRQLQTLRDLGACRTAALGAHLHQCADCQREVIVYNSCLNRHCPQCGSTARERWLAARSEELLPVPYCHVIFTLPHELIALALQNPRAVYGLLFRAASQALLTIAADPQRLGARLGFLAVLHTWNQKLLPHPHLHCLVPAGGLALDQTRWISCRHPHFFLPVQVLAAKFRSLFLALLRRAFRRGRLRLSGSLAPLQERGAFDRFTWALTKKVRFSPWQSAKDHDTRSRRVPAPLSPACAAARVCQDSALWLLSESGKKARPLLVLASTSAAPLGPRKPIECAPGASTGEREMPLLPTRQTRSAGASECRPTADSPAPADLRQFMIDCLVCLPWIRHGCCSAAAPDVCLNAVSLVLPLPSGLLLRARDAQGKSVQRSFS